MKQAFFFQKEVHPPNLYALSYGKVVSAHIDPVKKKSFFHSRPESQAHFIATLACTFSVPELPEFQDIPVSQRAPV